ncbi:hypothetical protein [Aminobacterium colombiense]|jgi:hypothetical protein|uniref:hypothetical protein n=1 Tax=Aminobacterium colombiense TaxID=81468 RepID=UPI000309B65D|nr:hypothetical protein [Aminobacterium colombiense]
MIKKLFFDTGCISSFLWVKEEKILLTLYPERIILPKQVSDELCNPSIPHILPTSTFTEYKTKKLKN